MEIIENSIQSFSNWIWDWPLLIILIGGGIFFLCYSRFTPFLFMGHAIRIVMGKYDESNEFGELKHFQSLMAAIAATVGLGNIAGVAVALVAGGPGAIFWMWISGLIGMATKFYTCTLAVLYREKDKSGSVSCGPMYVITNGLGGKWRPLAILFALAGLIGTLPMFTANQLTQTIVDVLDWDHKLYIGLTLAALTSLVIFGGIKRIGWVAGKMVPFMVALYFITVLLILILNYSQIPRVFSLIFTDAFSGNAVAGGVLGYLIKTGIKRGSFSNEAGIGTAPMMHGLAKTKEPIREGLVAMIGPAIDTLLVCTLTALAILSTDVWQYDNGNGITLTLAAFNKVLPYGIGDIILITSVLIFGFSTLFSYSYYGVACLGFLTKPKYGFYYNYIYIISIVIAAVVKIEVAINIIDSAFALMAIPTVISALLLAPKVNKLASVYFAKYK